MKVKGERATAGHAAKTRGSVVSAGSLDLEASSATRASCARKSSLGVLPLNPLLESLRMESGRESVVSMLSHVLSEFGALKGIHSGHDDVAVATIAKVEPVVKKALDHFALPPEAPLEDSAAQNLRALAAHMRAIANEAANKRAARDIEHEATRIDLFVTMRGTTLGVQGERFSKQRA